MNRSLRLAVTVTLLSATPGLAAKRGNDDRKRYCTGDAKTFRGDVDPDS